MSTEDRPETPVESTASLQLRQCAECGSPVGSDSRFCSACGTPLSSESGIDAAQAMGETAPIPALDADVLSDVAPGDGVLLIQKGPDQGEKFPLDQETVSVGRGKASDIFLDDVTVSRKHAIFTRTNSGWVLADNDSLNGTYVNRERVAKHSLRISDEVQIGKYRFNFFEVPQQ